MITLRLPRVKREDKPRRLPRSRPPGFVVLAGLTAALVVVGLVMVLSASSVESLSQYGTSWYYFERQLMWVALGGALMAVTMRVDYHWWRRWSAWVLGIVMFLLFAVLVPHVGVSVGGSSRWLGFGMFRIQPSEGAKLAVSLFLADLLARRLDKDGSPGPAVRAVVGVLLGVGALLMAQPDMGTTMVVGAIVMGMLFAAGAPGSWMAKIAGMSLAGGFLLGVAEPYRKARLTSFLHPWADRTTSGYQVVQSLVGLGSGGLAGVGLGASRAKWGFLPNAHTDFIFAIVGEELGLVGSIMVVALFVAFAVVGVRAARKAPDTFGMLLAVGITMWITAQAVLNIGAVISLLPVTGVPLPLVSYGGSSIVIIMGAIGILLNVASSEPRRVAARS